MQTITLQVHDTIFDKFQWLLKHFSSNEISIVNEIDSAKLSSDDFDYLSREKLDGLETLSQEYKKGKRDDFEEYKL